MGGGNNLGVEYTKTAKICHIWIPDCLFRLCHHLCVVTFVTIVASDTESGSFLLLKCMKKEVLLVIPFHCAFQSARGHSTLNILLLEIKMIDLIVHMWIATPFTTVSSSCQEICEFLSRNHGLLSIICNGVRMQAQSYSITDALEP